MTVQRGRVVSASSDGACSGNPGPGGWGALIRFEDGSLEEFGGYESATTNNRMELRAMLEIFGYLKNLPLHPDLTIKTDSKYLINGLTNWIQGWKKNGWKTSSGKPVLNQDLWQALDRDQLDNIKLEFVKGHSGDKDNERVDAIAVSYSKNKHINLQSKNDLTCKEKPSQVILSDSTKLTKTAPTNLQQLVSRLDMINHIAQEGYSLNTCELSELLKTPESELKQKESPFQWRDWLIKPIGNSKWKIKVVDEQPNSNEGNNGK